MDVVKTLSSECRRLLALSRDLFQTYDEDSVLALVKPVVSELLQPRVALFHLERNRGALNGSLDFNGEGNPVLLINRLQKALLENAFEIGNEGELELDVPLGNESTKDSTQGTLLAIGFPPGNPIGTLSALWTTTLAPPEKTAKREVLKVLAELLGAALGNITDKRSMQHDVELSAKETAEATRQLAENIRDHDDAMQEKDRIATTDVLTGLLNRRGFFERADQALKLARRNKTRCAVVFADLDDLKRVNDTLGHDTGDRLLRAAGNVFAASFRESDVVARLGGDEFSVFAVDAPGEAAVLERITESIANFHKTTTTPYRIAFSIGVVACDLSSTQSLADYLSIADRRMYLQKHSSRSH